MPSSPARLVSYLRRLATASGASEPGSDAGLLERFVQCRDENAFAALVDRHGPMVLRLCRRVLGDAHAAEDSFQATFLVLARKAGAIRRPQSLAAWLHGVAYRVAAKARKAMLRRKAHEVAAHVEPPATQPDPLADITARELLVALEEELQALPEVYRLPIVLCSLEGRSQEEAARQLGWTPASVRGRLERGRARLHARLARRGLTLTAGLLATEMTGALAGGTVPATLEAAIVKAAPMFAAGSCAAGQISKEAVSLAEGVLRAMFFSKLRILCGVVLLIGMLGAGAGVLTVYSRGGDPPADDKNHVAAPAPAAQAPEVPRELLQERLRAAKAAYEMTWRRFSNNLARPISPMDSGLPEWSRRWLQAEVAVVGDNKKDRIAAHEKHLARTLLLEKRVRASVNAGQTSQADAEAATYYRVEAEIWLIQAGGKLNRPGRAPVPKAKPKAKQQSFWIDPHSGNQYFVSVQYPE